MTSFELAGIVNVHDPGPRRKYQEFIKKKAVDRAARRSKYIVGSIANSAFEPIGSV
jgi:hypothetical protein